MFSEEDFFYMRAALVEAKIAFEEGEVPIGAILVQGKTIIARGRNSMEKNSSVLGHAEIHCIEQGSKMLKNWRLLDTMLYVTVEPCMMCRGAIELSRISAVIWGCPNLRYGSGIGRGGLLEEEAKDLLQTFFQKRRREDA